jgi:hypothetical protein
MSGEHHHDHHEDNSVNVKVALFFCGVLAAIIFIAIIN